MVATSPYNQKMQRAAPNGIRQNSRMRNEFKTE